MYLRSTAWALLLLAAIAHPAAAQQGRVTVSVLGGQRWNRPLFNHEAAFTQDIFQVNTTERLSVPEVTTAGARVSARVKGAWRVYAEGSHGSSHLGYLSDVHVRNTQAGLDGFERREARRHASLLTVGAGLGRAFGVPGQVAELELTAGGGVQRYSLNREPGGCASTSGGYICEDPDRWDSQYTVPVATGGFTLRRAIVPRAGLELHGAYSVGRVNTEGFYLDLVPALDAYEAPKHQTLRSGDLSLGVWVRP